MVLFHPIVPVADPPIAIMPNVTLIVVTKNDCRRGPITITGPVAGAWSPARCEQKHAASQQ
jgi:hypothetical protein